MTFSLVTYNVLAPSYALVERYAATPPNLLRPERRLEGLVERLRALDADVTCLQEVERPWFERLTRELGGAYACELAQKGQSRPDGCVLAARKERLVWTSARRIAFDDGNGGSASGHVMLVAELEHDRRPLAIATTHLKWDAPDVPPERRWALRQVREVIEARRASLVPPGAWIVCGDFNVTPDDEAVARLVASGLRDAHAGDPGATIVVNGRARRIDFILVGDAFDVVPDPLPLLEPSVPMPNEHEPSDHVPVRVVVSWRKEARS